MTRLESIFLIHHTHTHTHTQADTPVVYHPEQVQAAAGVGGIQTADVACLSHRTAGGRRRHVGNDAGKESSPSCQALSSK